MGRVAVRRSAAVLTLLACVGAPCTTAVAATAPSAQQASSTGNTSSLLDEALPTRTSAAAMCAPSVGGATCGGAGPATQGGSAGGGVDVGAGNPINLTNGNKYQQEIDLAPLPGVLGLEIVRHYNSALSRSKGRNGLVGRGWRLSYETTLHAVGSAIHVVQADGSRLVFNCSSDIGISDNGRRCASDDRAQGFIEVRPSAGGEAFTWHWTHGDGAGRQLGFDRAGRLARITAPTGEFVSLLYDAHGTLRKVVDPQGRTLEFHYPERRQAQANGRYAGVERIVSSAGTFHFAYGTEALGGEDAATISARRLALVSVTGPGSDSGAPVRRYHYEDARHPTLLTGISVDIPAADRSRRTVRLSTYAYDAAGRAVLSAQGTPVQFDEGRAAISGDIIHLQFRAAARHRRPGTTILTNADGAVTTYTVGLINNAYRLLEAKGAGCPRCGPVNARYRYDRLGRLIETAALDPASGRITEARRIAYDVLGRILRVDHLAHRQGKPVQVRWLQRFEYAGDETHPTLIARPSVVAGREHRLSLRYNSYGQLIEVHETGYSPVDDRGAPSPTGSPIERTTTYRYDRIGGRSVLVEVDGPLPNGPTASSADSDLTRYEHDEGGNRITSVIRPMGLAEHIEYDGAGRIVAHTPVDGVPIRYTLDAFGLPVRWERGNAVVDVERDGLGRPVRIALPDGEVRHIGHDGPGGLGAVVSNRGSGWWLRGAAVLPMDVATGAPRAVTKAVARYGDGPSPVRASGAAWPGLRQWVDDFGRLCALRTDAAGVEQFRHDLAGRLVERRFADGWLWRWTRDAAGRIVTHATQAPHDMAATTAELTYRGARLMRIAHPAEIETRAHDAHGRISTRTIERPSRLEAQGTPRLAYREHYAYDAADRLTRHTLPEGGELRYEWGVGSRLRGIDWVDSLRRTTRLISPRPASTREDARAWKVTDKAHGAWAMGGYRYGNGVETRVTMDRAGRLLELAHHLPTPDTESAWTHWLPVAHAAAHRHLEMPDGSPDAMSVVDRWRYTYDPYGRVSSRSDVRQHTRTDFAFDADSQLLAAQSDSASEAPEYYAYDANGETLGRRVRGQTDDFRRDTITRTAGGLPERIALRVLRYSGDRRLTEVAERTQEPGSGGNERPIARYEHNALGQRIGKTVFGADPTDSFDKRSTQYLWQSYRLVGEMPESGPAGTLARRYVYAHGVPVAAIDYPAGRRLALQRSPLADTLRELWRVLTGDAPRFHYIHSNEIGTPTAVTNESRQVVWRTTHTAFGEAHPIASADGKARFTLDLRLPGQYHDAETGWHDNVLRTYDPRRGQYLEPDPLGPHPLTRPYAYAGNNPLMYADPLGLILFAFDGTNNDESSRTNVYWLREAYDDNDPRELAGATRPYYVTGPGTDDWAFGDAAVAYLLKPKVTTQLRRLDDYVRAKFKDETEVQGNKFSVENPMIITLDVIGFSRGAAAARDFANEVIGRKNDGYYRDLVGGACVGIVLRFMGLFDTVLSAQINGRLNLSIPYSQIGNVAHAVALNEHRALFPLESAESSYADRGFGANVIERGFVGAHADVGGGYVVEDGGDLSDVALNWMHRQAVAAGVAMKPLEDAQLMVTQPILHDESPMFPWALPAFGGLCDDREVRYPDRVLQQRAAEIEAMTYAESRAYIVAPTVEPTTPNPYLDGVSEPTPTRTNRAGAVDMDAYRAWLHSNYSLSIN